MLYNVFLIKQRVLTVLLNLSQKKEVVYPCFFIQQKIHKITLCIKKYLICYQFLVFLMSCNDNNVKSFWEKLYLPSGSDFESAWFFFLLIRGIVTVKENKATFFGFFVETLYATSLRKTNKWQKYSDEIPQDFPFIKLDEMVVMPNHIHGILWIDNDDAVACRRRQ